MKILFYDDPPLQEPTRAIFLAGPTVSAKAGERTAWRMEALRMLEAWDLLVVVPEFERGGFRREPFDDGQPSAVPGLRRSSQRILDWETRNIDNAQLLLVWMPFALGSEGSPDSLPGFSTRAEAMRAIAMGRRGLVLGMPPGALAGGQIRYHAHRQGYVVYEALGDAVRAAIHLAGTLRLDRSHLPSEGAP